MKRVKRVQSPLSASAASQSRTATRLSASQSAASSRNAKGAVAIARCSVGPQPYSSARPKRSGAARITSSW